MYPPNHPLLMEAFVDDRIRELRRDADAWRLTARSRHPSATRRATARSLYAVGFWLVGAGLRLAPAGLDRRAPGP
jgi:hypothetical protein